MAMQMGRAFDARMMTRITRYSITTGAYDGNNSWVEGVKSVSTLMGVVQTGNKFSQFDEGEALHIGDGGERFSDYRTLYTKTIYTVSKGDVLSYQGTYFKVIQTSDEATFGFMHYLLEKLEKFTP